MKPIAHNTRRPDHPPMNVAPSAKTCAHCGVVTLKPAHAIMVGTKIKYMCSDVCAEKYEG